MASYFDQLLGFKIELPPLMEQLTNKWFNLLILDYRCESSRTLAKSINYLKQKVICDIVWLSVEIQSNGQKFLTFRGVNPYY